MKLPEDTTIEKTAALAGTLASAVAESSGALTIDASAVKAVDTSTIALLLQARRLAQAAGRGFQVNGAPAKLADLARLYGVEELLSLSSTSRTGSA